MFYSLGHQKIRNLEENQQKILEKFLQHTVGLVETYLKLFKLEMTITLAEAVSMIILMLTVGSLLAFTGLFFGLFLAYMLSTWLEIALLWGFLIVAGLYLAGFWLVIGLREQIKQFIFAVIERVMEHKNE